MLALAALASLLFLIIHLFLFFTKVEPSKGGEYTEGILGQPSYINPVLSQTSEADSDLAQLIFSGLLKYDGQGNLMPDLAERYELSEEGKVYTIKIKENAKWHDGEPLKADDVIFTIRTVQDPAFRSPLRQNWQGVEVEQIDDYSLKITLKSQYSGFAENLTMGIIPKHIWENVAPDRFYLSEHNLRPIGSGPYQFFDFRKDQEGNILSYKMRSFPGYYGGEAYITRFNANFYLDEDSLLTAYNDKKIDGMNTISPGRSDSIKAKKSTQVYEVSLPRYFAVFLNQTKNVALATDKVREALSLATDRNEIIEKVLQGKGTAIYSSVLPQMDGYSDEADKHEFNFERATSILEEEGWKVKEGEAVRMKDNNRLEFEVLTLDWPELAATAEILKEQWAKIGAELKINVLSISDLQQNYIRPREYPALLFGQATSFNPDFYSFWHSSQKRDPGLNLALFDDKKADEILDRLRTGNDEKKIEDLKEFQNILAKEIPAIFLYSPTYLYPVGSEIKGIDVHNINSPSWRFADVSKWYIKTKRVKK